MRLNQPSNNKHDQQGSMLIIAIFVIVVMSILATAMLNVLTKSSSAVAYEVLGQRSFLAAQAGLQFTAAQLFPLGQTTATDCTAAVNGIGGSFSVDGLTGCSLAVSCNNKTIDSTSETIYTLTSIGSCAGGDYQTTRELRVEARVLN